MCGGGGGGVCVCVCVFMDNAFIKYTVHMIYPNLKLDYLFIYLVSYLKRKYPYGQNVKIFLVSVVL